MCITAMSKMHAKILMFKRNFVVYLKIDSVVYLKIDSVV